MTIAAVFTMLVLTGFNLSWSSVPSRPGSTGSAEVTVEITEEDLIAISTDHGAQVSYEITATMDGEGFLRRSSTVTDGSFPINELLVYNSLETGGHVVSVTLTDLESRLASSSDIEIFIDVANGTLWSSGGVRISPDGQVRASGYVNLSWNVYIPENEEGNEPPGAYALLDRTTDVVLEGWLTSEFRGDGVVFYTADVSLFGIEKGRYRFTVAALQGDSVVASSSSSISILESWDIWGDDLNETKTLIRPIASVHEIRELDRTGGQGDRNSVMADFWARRDPVSATRENEYLEAYLIRLDLISSEFSTTGVRGINTDRGVVYAKMGEPDIVKNYPFEIEQYPYITWEYFTPSLALSFVDQDGYGYYEMVQGWDSVDRAFNSREEWSL